MNRVECTIFGRVQGVFFRDFARENATSIGITGTVENEDGGAVKIVAEGEKELLEKFIEILKEGPEIAQVEDLSLEWNDGTGEFSDFSIIY